MTSRKAIASLAGATVVSRALGFIRIIVISAVLGTTALGNTFQSSNAVSNVLFDLLAAGALSAAIIPQLVHALDKSERELKNLVSSLITLVIIFLGFVAIVGVVFAQQISELLFARAPILTRDDQIRTGTILLRFFIPQVVLYGIGAVAVAALNAKKKFIAQVIAPIGGSIFIMAVLIIFHYFRNVDITKIETVDTIILSIAGTGACIAYIAIPVVSAMKNGFSFMPNFNLKDGLKVLSSSTWAVAIQASAAIILGITLYIGNKLNGAVVAYQLAYVFFLAPYAIISQSFSTVLLPDLSLTAIRTHEKHYFESHVKNMLRWTYIPMVISTAFIIAMSAPLTSIVAQGKAGSGRDMVEIAFITLVLGIVPYSIYQATSRVYFAKSNVRLPALTVLVATFITCGVSYVASRHVSGNSLVIIMGLCHSVTYLLSAFYLSVKLRVQNYKVLPDKSTLMVIGASVVYAATFYFITNLFDFSSKIFAISYLFVFTLINIMIVYIALPLKYRSKISLASLKLRLGKG
ncbi:MAG: lipid II flippase MurJ [Acidimicrobiia bacterium]